MNWLKRAILLVPLIGLVHGMLAFATVFSGDAKGWDYVPGILGMAYWMWDGLKDSWPQIHFKWVDLKLRLRNPTARLRVEAQINLVTENENEDPDWDEVERQILKLVRDAVQGKKVTLEAKGTSKSTYSVPLLGLVKIQRDRGSPGDKPRIGITFDNLAVAFTDYRKTIKDYIVPIVAQLIGLANNSRALVDRETFGYYASVELEAEHPLIAYLRKGWEPVIGDLKTVHFSIKGAFDEVNVMNGHAEIQGRRTDRLIDSVSRLLDSRLAA